MNADEHGLKRAMRSLLLGAAVTLVTVAAAEAATPVPSGKWSFVFTDRQGLPDRPIRVYTYRPRQCDSTCPMLIALHGKNRRASAMRDHFELAADRHGFLVVAPEFSEKHWPKAGDYQLGRVADEKDRRLWTYAVIERLFDEMRDGQKDYRLFGHSAGAQFVHRMALLMPENRASVVLAANAGWYLMPEWRKDKDPSGYPHSLVGSPAGEGELRTAMGRRLVARDLGVKFAWELAYVPGAGHEASKMARAAADHLAGAKQ
jgi:poly(3-hydroxybutyrate) depolymerase